MAQRRQLALQYGDVVPLADALGYLRARAGGDDPATRAKTEFRAWWRGAAE